MNYARYWRGTMYVCDVYDKALTGGELNKVLNNLPAPNIIIRENYNPNGSAFSNTADVNWENQELCVSMNLDNCHTSGMENVISIGLNIASWAGNNIHFYYDKNNSGRMLVQCMIGGAAQNIDLSNVYGDFTVKFNSNGLTINNTLYATANYSSIFTPILESNTIQVGSTEGTGRTYATNYRIEIKSKDQR
jgi:hypothetical protein